MKQQRKAWKAYVYNQVKIPTIRAKLLRARFNSEGNLAPGQAKEYIEKHFPNLLRAFYEKGPGIKQITLF